MDDRVPAVLAYLRRYGSRRNIAGMARYGITSPKVFGTPGPRIKALARRLGRDHELARALWNTGWLEARSVATFVEEPARMTAAQIDAWAADFDNWAVCDGCCIHLFDRTPFAWDKIRAWSTRPDEYVRRAGFALLAAVACHDKRAPDAVFLAALPLIEQAAGDGRNYVKKAVSWALRTIGKRSSAALRRAALATARRLAASDDRTSRWIGRDAQRDIAAYDARQRRRPPSRGTRGKSRSYSRSRPASRPARSPA